MNPTQTILATIGELEQIVRTLAYRVAQRAELAFNFIPENGDIDAGGVYAQWQAVVRLDPFSEVVAYGFTFPAAARYLLARLNHQQAYHALHVTHLLQDSENPLTVFRWPGIQPTPGRHELTDVGQVESFLAHLHELEQQAATADVEYVAVKLRFIFMPDEGGGGIPEREADANWQADNTIGVDFGRTIAEAAARLLDRVHHPEAYPPPNSD